MQNNIKVSAYCRVSTDKDDQIHSLASQIAYFTDYICRQEGWIMGEVFYDEGISGTSTKKRDGFRRMMSEASDQHMDLILTKEVSRFARNTVDTLLYTRQLKSMGIGVLFTLDNIDTRDNDGELRLSIMASLAQEESRKTSERVKWGHKRRMEQGVVFGRDLLGYSVRNGKLYLNEEEAEIVRLIFHKYLSEEKGTHVIARELQTAGISPLRAGRWNNTVILKMLRNEKYVGDLRQKKTYTPDYLTHNKKYNRGQEDHIFIENHHEPIISRSTWNAVQKELERRSITAEMKSKHSNRYWCSGRLICAACGQRFVRRTRKRKDGSLYQAWRCSTAVSQGTARTAGNGVLTGCSICSVNEKVLLSAMSYVLTHIQMDADKTAEALTIAILKDIPLVMTEDIFKDGNRQIQREIPTEILQKIQAEFPADICCKEQLSKLQADCSPEALFCQKKEQILYKKSHVIDLVLEGLITKEDMVHQTARYSREIEQLEKQMQSIQAASKTHKKQINHKINPKFGLKNEIIQLMSFHVENVLLYRELLDHITIAPDHELIIYLKFLPYGIRVHAITSGKSETYQVKIDRMTIEARE